MRRVAVIPTLRRSSPRMPGPRVMFIHGLEGRPDGTKAQQLRAQGLEVVAADMHMSVWQLSRRNSVIRNILRARALHLGLAVLAAGIVAGVVVSSVWPALLGTLAGIVTMVHHMFGGLGAYVGALSFDRTGSYDSAFAVMALTSLLSIGLVMMLKPGRP